MLTQFFSLSFEVRMAFWKLQTGKADSNPYCSGRGSLTDVLRAHDKRNRDFLSSLG